MILLLVKGNFGWIKYYVKKIKDLYLVRKYLVKLLKYQYKMIILWLGRLGVVG